MLKKNYATERQGVHNMSDQAKQAAERMREALGRMKEELPQLAPIFESFEELLTAQAAFKAGLPELTATYDGVDLTAYGQGAPLYYSKPLEFDQEYLKSASTALMPGMTKAFTGISDDLNALSQSLDAGDLSPEVCKAALEKLEDPGFAKVAEKWKFNTGTGVFVLYRLLRPIAEKHTASLMPLPKQPEWNKGYCPVCGSQPEMSIIEGVEGHRRLRCAFCACEWPYPRLQCPFCENSQQDKLDVLYSEDRSFERAELCHVCRRYLVGLDLRNSAGELIPEIEQLALLYLDVLAQEKGFIPGSGDSWSDEEESAEDE
jgi:FdhE protein